MKLSCVRLKLRNVQRRVVDGTAHQPGVDYRDAGELLADLDLIGSSLREHGGALIADGSVARVRRLVATFGFTLAAMDVREHADAHHHAVGSLLTGSASATPPTPTYAAPTGSRCCPANSPRADRWRRPRPRWTGRGPRRSTCSSRSGRRSTPTARR